MVYVMLADLLSKGYFPRELPPPFTATDFAAAVANSWPSMNPVLSSNRQRRNGLPTRPCRHSVARKGGLRRPLAIPNPFSQLLLCLEVQSSWKAIHGFVHGGSVRPLRSASRPVYWRNQSRALIPRYKFSALPYLRMRSRIGARYLVRTDISRFYPTLYTHSIPWALHGIATAKANRTPALLGNRLDKLARDQRDGQTNGIAIGPDTSLLLAETVLRGADDVLGRILPSRAGFRYVDDYELPCLTLREAEETLRMVEATLAKFELSLNPTKTGIEELPAPLTEAWADELRSMPLGSTSAGQQRSLLAYFTRAYELTAENSGVGVLSYAAARLRGFVPVSGGAWGVLQGGLLNCAVSEPACLPYVLDLLVRGSQAGLMVSKPALSQIVHRIIENHALLGHGSEVAWSLWAALAFDIRLDKEAGDAVVMMDDDVVALLALHAQSMGRFSHPLSMTLWQGHMNGPALNGEHWLLAYEGAAKGWLGGPGHLLADPRFGPLHQLGVSFYDVTGGGLVLPTATAPLPGGDIGQVSVAPVSMPQVGSGGGLEYV